MMSDQYAWDLSRQERAVDFPDLYDVQKAKQLLVSKPRLVEDLDLEKYGAVLRDYMDGVRLKPDVEWSNIDVTLPVIFVRTEHGKFAIDGRHRLEKALREGLKTVPAVFLSEEETRSIQICQGQRDDVPPHSPER